MTALDALREAFDRGEAVIPLYADGHRAGAYALIDAVLYEPLALFSWHVSSQGYAIRAERKGSRVTHVAMHRQILGLQPGEPLQADHINGERLDNRRANLRVVTHKQNCQNLHLEKRRPGTSRHRGVFWNKARNRWVALVTVDGTSKQRHFRTEEEAAVAVGVLRAEMMPFSEEALRDAA